METQDLGELLGLIAMQEAEEAAGLHHLELLTRTGLLTILWHGDRSEDAVVITCGGASGSLIGPARGLYPHLGATLPSQGIGVLRVGYRRPNDLESCVHDLVAAAELAFQSGAQRMITMGHSFGGAVAVCAATELPQVVRGVATFATQSAGCEAAALLGGRPLVLFHGDRDPILPVDASEMVRLIAGEGELVVLPGTGHMLAEAASAIRERLAAWIPETLGHEPSWLQKGEE